MRIMLALAGRELTAQGLAELLRDIPQATLYRHLNRMVKAGVLKVVAERQVRGTVEKIYTLDEQLSTLTEADLKGASKDDHLRYFLSFVAGLLGDYQRYLDSVEQIDLEADGIGYHKHIVELTDEEMHQLGQALQKTFQASLEADPQSPRRRRLFSTVMMPYIETER
jgi:DNA-binding transcriptional ArsR family regulator